MVYINIIELSLALFGTILGIFNVFDMIKVKIDATKIKEAIAKNVEANKVHQEEIRDKLNNHLNIYYSRHEELRALVIELSKNGHEEQKIIEIKKVA